MFVNTSVIVVVSILLFHGTDALSQGLDMSREVVFVANHPPEASLVETMETRLKEEGASLRVVTPSSALYGEARLSSYADTLLQQETIALVIWLDHAEGTMLHLYFGAADHSVRAIDSQSTAESETSIAIIVANALRDYVADAQLQKEKTPVQTVSTGPAAPKGVTEEKAPTAVPYAMKYTRLMLSLGYAGVSLNDDLWAHGIQVGADIMLIPHLHAEIGYIVSIPEKQSIATDPGMEYRLLRHPILMGVSGRATLKRARFSLKLLLALDPVNIQRSTLDGTSGTGTNSMAVSLLPCFDVGISILQRLGLFVAAGVEIQVNPLDYRAIDADFNFIRWTDVRQFRPYLAAGVSVPLI